MPAIVMLVSSIALYMGSRRLWREAHWKARSTWFVFGRIIRLRLARDGFAIAQAGTWEQHVRNTGSLALNDFKNVGLPLEIVLH